MMIKQPAAIRRLFLMRNDELRSACGTILIVGEADSLISHSSFLIIHF